MNTVREQLVSGWWRPVLVSGVALASLVGKSSECASQQSSSPDSARIYVDQSIAALRSGMPAQLRAALPTQRRAIELFRARGDATNVAEETGTLGQLYQALGRPDSALIWFQRATTQFHGLRNHARESLSLRLTADLFQSMGRSDSAVSSARRAVEVARNAPNRSEEISALSALGQLWNRLREPDSAISASRQAIAVARSASDSNAIAGTMRQMANLFRENSPAGSPGLDSAEKYLRAVIEIYRHGGAPPNRIALVLTDLARVHHSAQRWQAEIDVLRESLAMTGGSNDSLFQAQRLRGIGDAFRMAARFDSALASYRHALDVAGSAAAAAAARERGLIRLATAFAFQFQKQTSWDSVSKYANQAVSDLRVAGPPEAHRDALKLLASAAVAANQPDSALAIYKVLLTLASEARDSARSTARVQLDLAGLFGELHQPDSVTRYAGAALRRFAGLKDKVGEFDALRMLADVARESGRPDSAVALLKLARKAAQSNNDLIPENVVVHEISKLYHDYLGLPDSALAYARQGLKLAREIHSSPLWEAGALELLTGTFVRKGLADSALVYARRLEEVTRQVPNPGWKASAPGAMGNIYHSVGVFDSAAIYTRRALALARAAGSESQQEATLLLNNLALTLMAGGQIDIARAYLREALASARTSRDAVGEAQAALYLGNLDLWPSEPDSALFYSRLAVDVMKTKADNAFGPWARTQLAMAFAAIGAQDSALTNYQIVLNLPSDQQSFYTPLTHKGIADLYRTSRAGRNLPLAAAHYDSAAALMAAMRRGAGKDAFAVSFAEMHEAREVFAGWMHTWIARQSEVGVSRSASASLAAVERGRSQALLDLIERPIANVDTEPPPALPTGSTTSSAQDLSAETDSLLASLRAKKSAALSYAFVDDTLYTWLLRPSGELTLLPPRAIPRSQLNDLVRVVRAGLDANDPTRRAVFDPDELAGDTLTAKSTTGDLSTNLRRLADLVLPADLAGRLSPGTDLVVVPSGPLTLVPFAALPVRGSRAAPDSGARGAAISDTTRRTASRNDSTATAGDELGLRYAVRYTPSLAALRSAERRASASKPSVAAAASLRTSARAPSVAKGAASTKGAAGSRPTALVVGNPSMPAVYSGRWVSRGPMQPLPGAEAEARSVAGVLGVKPLIGKAATETAILSLLPSARIVHLATHGLAYSAEAKARLSFVALAPDTVNNGLLTVGEILDDPRLTLSADLVVLSACQTGLGNLKEAEGTVGLQRAFLARGARSVLVSLWNVDDRATRLLMERFYSHWLDRAHPVSKSEALRLAQRDLQRMPAYSHPRYWAAFQLVGAQ